MELFPIIIGLLGIIIGTCIFYFIIESAVRNGVKQAIEQTEQHAHNEFKKAIRDSVKAVLESREKQNMYEIRKAIYDGVKAAIEDARDGS